MAVKNIFVEVCVFLVCVGCVTSQVYVDTGYPYDLGEFNVSMTNFLPQIPINPPPIQSRAYYPTVPGDYAVMYFVTGFAGIAPPFLYDDFMTMVASHGYIIFSQWNLFTEGGPEISPEIHIEMIQWLQENAADDLEGAIPSFEHLSLGCNSAGCGTTLRIAANYSDMVMSMVNLEPVSLTIQVIDVDFSIPALNYGAELANMSCSFPGVDFEAWQKTTLCPKIMMESAGVGHCDILDQESWQVCRTLEFCNVTTDDHIYQYKMAIQGVVSSFMTGYVQGNMDQLEYITDESEIPWQLNQHEVDIACRN